MDAPKRRNWKFGAIEDMQNKSRIASMQLAGDVTCTARVAKEARHAVPVGGKAEDLSICVKMCKFRKKRGWPRRITAHRRRNARKLRRIAPGSHS